MPCKHCGRWIDPRRQELVWTNEGLYVSRPPWLANRCVWDSDGYVWTIQHDPPCAYPLVTSAVDVARSALQLAEEALEQARLCVETLKAQVDQLERAASWLHWGRDSEGHSG